MKHVKLFEGFTNSLNSLLNESKGEDAIEILFKKLVGPSGPAETEEGELVRAMMKVMYRNYNDGDYFFKNYGVETAGPAMIYLMKKGKDIPGFTKALNACAKVAGYTANLDAAAAILADYITLKDGKYTPNTGDMYADENYQEASAKWGPRNKHSAKNRRW